MSPGKWQFQIQSQPQSDSMGSCGMNDGTHLEASERGFHTPKLSATGSRLHQQTQAPRYFWTPVCRMGKAAPVAQG